MLFAKSVSTKLIYLKVSCVISLEGISEALSSGRSVKEDIYDDLPYSESKGPENLSLIKHNLFVIFSLFRKDIFCSMFLYLD